MTTNKYGVHQDKYLDFLRHDQYLQRLQVQKMDGFTSHFMLKQNVAALFRFNQAVALDQEGNKGDHHEK